MSLIRRISLLMVLVVLLALVGGVVTTLIAARNTLQTQLSLKNRDNAQALALALSQQRGDMALMELVLAAQFDTGHYRSIDLSGDGRAPFRREADAMATVAPAWFVAGLPLRAEPGVAQVSDGWRTIGRIELVSQSAYASDALWRAGLHAAELLALVGLVGAGLAACVLEEPLGEWADLVGALAQGRDPQRHRVEPVQEVEPEPAGLDHRLEVAVGRRDHADVDVDLLVAADPRDLLGLEHAQECGLRRRRELADLVE